MKTALVTGAGGALGKEVVVQLGLKADWQILGCSRRASGKGMLVLDVSDRAQVFRVIETTKPDLILHLAATLSDNFDEAYAVNVCGARNLCEAVLAASPPTRLLLAGSAAEYGVVEATDNPIPVNQPLKPVSLYGMTKAWQTTLGQYYANSGVDVVLARIFNLDGPGLSEKLFVGRIEKQIAALKAGQQSRLQIGSLSAIRDYVSMATAAQQILAIAEHGTRGAVYHVGSGKGISMRDLLQATLARNGLDFALVDEASGNSNRKGYDVPVIFADMSDTAALQSRAQRKV